MRKILNAPVRQRVHAIRDGAAGSVPAPCQNARGEHPDLHQAALESSLKGSLLIRESQLLPADGPTENLSATQIVDDLDPARDNQRPSEARQTQQVAGYERADCTGQAPR